MNHEVYSELLNIPKYCCFEDERVIVLNDVNITLQKIWLIGGENGWYYANWLWRLRGFIDELFGGVGLKRGRKNKTEIFQGDSLDFWKVLYADKEEKKLLLYAEMKLPGKAWLEFKIIDNRLYQTATFQPFGFLGFLYWYCLMPFHSFIFRNMIKKISS